MELPKAFADSLAIEREGKDMAISTCKQISIHSVLLTLLIVTGLSHAAETFTATVTGTGTETWTTNDEKLMDSYSSSTLGKSLRRWMIQSNTIQQYRLKIEAKSRSTVARVNAFKSPDGVNWTNLATVSCSTDDSTFSCSNSIPLFLSGFPERYEWEVELTTTNPPFQFGEAKLIYFEQVTNSEVLIGTPFSKPDVVELCGTSKNIGGFRVVFSPRHGGTLSSKSFSVSSNNPNVGVVFSNTNTTSTTSESASLLASIIDCPTGRLRVTIIPKEAVELGAEWRLRTGPTWYPSDFVLTNLLAGSYTLEFKPLPDSPDWMEPNPRQVQIAGGLERSEEGTYICIPLAKEVVYIDGSYTGTFEKGSERFPFKTIRNAMPYILPRGRVLIKTGSYQERLVLQNQMTLEARGGAVVIGR